MEVLTAVAILGILASIAIPNFTRYINKSKQSEAKANLEMFYSAEKAFFFSKGFYAARLDGMGFNPAGRLNYRIGFGVDSGAGGPTTPSGTPGCFFTGGGTCSASTRMRPTWSEGNSATAVSLDAGAAVSGSPKSFRAQARGRINGVTDDTWEIDHRKNLTNTTTAL